MKKFIVSVLILACIVLILVLSPVRQWFRPDDRFAVADTAAITRIEIMAEDTVRLERHEGQWILNGSFKASQIAVSNFLFVMKRIEKTGIDLNQLPGEAKGVRIRMEWGRNRQLLRFYSWEGVNYLQHEGSVNLYPVSVPGFPNADPARVFSAGVGDWIDRVLLSLDAGEIDLIQLEVPEEWGRGFILRRDTAGFRLDPLSGEKENRLPNPDRLLMYPGYFKEVWFEQPWVRPEWYDPSRPGEALFRIEIKTKDGDILNLDIFPLLTNTGETDHYKALVQKNGEGDYLVCPWQSVDLLLQSYEDFFMDFGPGIQ